MKADEQQLGNLIGKGQFGVVFRALNLDTGQMVAIKRIAVDGMEDEEIEEVMREVELLKRLDHPSIVKYEGMCKDAEYLNIVLELVSIVSSMGEAYRQICGEWLFGLGSESFRQIQRATRSELHCENPRGFGLSPHGRSELPNSC